MNHFRLYSSLFFVYNTILQYSAGPPSTRLHQEHSATMKVFTSIAILVSSSLVGAAPYLEGRAGPAISKLDALLPRFGVVAGTNRDANQNCQGINPAGKITPIQCQCPPDRSVFLSKLSNALAVGKVSVPDASGAVHEFPITFSLTAAGSDVAANRDRATAALTVLQNFDGTFGKGCPAVSVPNIQSMQSTGIRVDTQFVPPV
ncbi:hypothetical protein BR93DRAFT_202197 [Coniochaeta sp. PMI_546]|nr:hypothetical protein BR93DRAFT_202197 [Coniochaeta sp. PMI_546]